MTNEIHPDTLIGKEISNVEIGKFIAFINFTDGTNISVSHDGDRLNMIHRNEQGDVLPVVPWCD